jgi:hypothetical protein
MAEETEENGKQNGQKGWQSEVSKAQATISLFQFRVGVFRIKNSLALSALVFSWMQTRARPCFL